MVLDLVLQDYLKEDLAYSENKEVATLWQQYSSRKQPTSRPLEQIKSGQEQSVNKSSLQLSF